jgi:hypothetical protein
MFRKITFLFAAALLTVFALSVALLSHLTTGDLSRETDPVARHLSIWDDYRVNPEPCACSYRPVINSGEMDALRLVSAKVMPLPPQGCGGFPLPAVDGSYL